MVVKAPPMSKFADMLLWKNIARRSVLDFPDRWIGGEIDFSPRVLIAPLCPKSRTKRNWGEHTQSILTGSFLSDYP
jgi:hypothetical protein